MGEVNSCMFWDLADGVLQNLTQAQRDVIQAISDGLAASFANYPPKAAFFLREEEPTVSLVWSRRAYYLDVLIYTSGEVEWFYHSPDDIPDGTLDLPEPLPLERFINCLVEGEKFRRQEIRGMAKRVDFATPKP